jgi:transcriptional regulator with XRE-family HTH domain
MGTRLRAIRRAQGTSLRALAQTVGVSAAYLSQVESGKRALDRHSLIVILAEALGSSPDVFTALPVPAPGNGGIDSAIEAVRQALLAVGLHRPGGQVVALDSLRARAAATVTEQRRGERLGEVGTATAELIRDLHSSIDADPDPAASRDLAVRFHTHATLDWLRVVGAPVDLRLEAANAAHRVARDLATPAALGLAAYGGLSAMISAGLLDLARTELDAIDMPATDAESTQLAGMLALCGGLLAAMDSRPDESAAAFDQAAQLAERTGEGDASWMGFGPATVALWRMSGLLDMGHYRQAAHIGVALHPLDPLPPLGQADYWVSYARALARMQSRRDHAVQALLRAEEISPHRLYRDPFARDLIAELFTRSRGAAADRELHDLARRAGVTSHR